MGTVRRGGATVAVGRVEIAAPPRLLATCVAGHRTDESAAVTRAATSLVRARRRPRGDRCGACGSRLDMPERRGRRALTVEPDGAPPATLEVMLPLRRCSDCAVDNVPSRDARALRQALRRIVGTDGA